MTAIEQSIQLSNEIIKSHMKEIAKLQAFLLNENLSNKVKESFKESLELYKKDLKFMIEFKKDLTNKLNKTHDNTTHTSGTLH